jgi:uncharacterized protein (UPF0333 family)
MSKVQLKLLEMWNRLQGQRGQTSAEYVAVTAVAVAIAITVIYATMSESLSSAVEAIGGNITEFVANNPAPPEEPAP